MPRSTLLAVATVLALVACTGGTGTPAGQNPAQAAGLLSASGALQCAPSTGQLTACAASAAGAACSLAVGWDGGTTLPGTCHPTLDGTQVACVPNPPAPPSTLVSACTGKNSGDSCQATGKFADTFQGTCLTLPGSTTLFCGRVHTPPAVLVDACTGKAAGEACSRPERWDAGTEPGTCQLGPSGTGPLLCGPSETRGVAACSGLDAGASCRLGFGHRHDWDDAPSGSCVVPAAGGPATCLVPCDTLRAFHGHGMEGHWGWGGGGPRGPWWHSDAGPNAP